MIGKMQLIYSLPSYTRGLITGLLLTGIPLLSLFGQSIAEKKANLQSSEGDLGHETEQFLMQVNKETQEIHAHINQLYEEALRLYQEQAPPEEYQSLLEQINMQKRSLIRLENAWREMASRTHRTEEYGLWHAPDTTIEQLIIDYGSLDYVYLIPPEVGGIKLSIDSNLPIPRAAWSEMLELILTQNGVGIRELNPYLRQVYLVKESNYLRLITNQREDLEVLPPDVRVCFVLSPEPSEVRRSFSFLEKFINPNTTVLQILGRDILLIGPVGDIKDLLRLYDFISINRGEKDYSLLPLRKVGPEEMTKILSAIFDQSESSIVHSGKGGKADQSVPEASGLRIVPLQDLSQALFIVGTREEVRKAEEIIQNVESQVAGGREKTVFWYTVKHSDPEELADVLYRVYALMIATGTGCEEGQQASGQGCDNNQANPPCPPNVPQKEPPSTLYGEEGYYQEGGFIVNPEPIEPRVFTETNPNSDRENFIVDAKTGAIVMVVEADVLPKIKDLLGKLDIPKKMVQIETLLFEKVLTRENSFGLNLLRIGAAAERNRYRNSYDSSGNFFNNIYAEGFDSPAATFGKGLFDFFFSNRKSHCGIPAFELVYRFLLSQDDIQINSCPSILTINQTPATIAVNEDISINTGVFEVETAKGVTLKDAFTRAQYGITISLKPTIHMAQCDDEDPEKESYDYVTLETDITFDTIQGGNPSRPDVVRRHISNQVQVPDGETIILGGLRRKVTQDGREAIPFLGELPGIGKLFSLTELRETSTEMFIFITPHIVKDPKEQLACLRQELLCVRPGDIPYFLECVEEANRFEKSRLMEGSMSILFGRTRDRYYVPDDCKAECECPAYDYGEYDGR